jgi:hypothetical protein
MRKIILPLIILFFCFSHCHKDQQPDPNSFYFQCKIDGQLYIPANCSNCMDAMLLGDTTLILGGNNGFQSVGIGINDNMNIKATSYILNEVIGSRGDYKFSTTTDDRYFTDASHTGQLTISTLDKTNKIVSGIFFFQGYNPVQNKTASITEGKFRINYITN